MAYHNYYGKNSKYGKANRKGAKIAGNIAGAFFNAATSSSSSRKSTYKRNTRVQRYSSFSSGSQYNHVSNPTVKNDTAELGGCYLLVSLVVIVIFTICGFIWHSKFFWMMDAAFVIFAIFCVIYIIVTSKPSTQQVPRENITNCELKNSEITDSAPENQEILFDPLIKDVAKVICGFKFSCPTSYLEKRYMITRHRAITIMEQLEKLKIVELERPSSSLYWIVLIKDEEQINEILKMHNIQ